MSPRFLTDIITKKREEVATLYQKIGLSKLKDAALNQNKRPCFKSAIETTGLSLIAELKKASPSKGLINPNFDPVSLAQYYERNGARALSVLTETAYFLGDPQYLKQVSQHSQLPLLRKDFIIDPIQVYESRTLGASAILLIVAILDQDQLIEYSQIAEEIGLSCLIEVHDDSEIDQVLSLKTPYILGINNRDLRSFKVNPSQAISLKKKSLQTHPNLLVVAESGYQTSQELKHLNDHQINGVLIGEGLVKNPDLLNYF